MSSRKTVWQQFSKEIQATYVKGGFTKSARIEATFKSWQIVYDIFVVIAGTVIFEYTRLRAPIAAKSEFKIRISKKSFFHKIAGKFRKANIATGDSSVDNAFVIKSNSAEKAKKLLSNEKLKSLLLESPKTDFEISHGYKSVGRKFPKNCDGLSLIVLFDNKDEEKLMLLYNLFCEILTSLHEAGEIDDTTINVKI